MIFYDITLPTSRQMVWTVVPQSTLLVFPSLLLPLQYTFHRSGKRYLFSAYDSAPLRQPVLISWHEHFHQSSALAYARLDVGSGITARRRTARQSAIKNVAIINRLFFLHTPHAGGRSKSLSLVVAYRAYQNTFFCNGFVENTRSDEGEEVFITHFELKDKERL